MDISVSVCCESPLRVGRNYILLSVGDCEARYPVGTKGAVAAMRIIAEQPAREWEDAIHTLVEQEWAKQHETSTGNSEGD